jgi:hypothetical protein
MTVDIDVNKRLTLAVACSFVGEARARLTQRNLKQCTLSQRTSTHRTSAPELAYRPFEQQQRLASDRTVFICDTRERLAASEMTWCSLKERTLKSRRAEKRAIALRAATSELNSARAGPVGS